MYHVQGDAMPRYSNEQIIEILKNLAERLGQTTLSKKDVASIIPTSTVSGRFGNIGNALEAAGLRRKEACSHFRERGVQIEENELFAALYKVECTIGHEPGCNECSAHCEYSLKPYRNRFGKWSNVLSHYRKWKLESEQLLPSLALGTCGNSEGDFPLNAEEKAEQTLPGGLPISIRKEKAPNQFDGEPIDFRGLRHAPINEQGVVFLFAMVSRELGFNIESVQQGFPDCEGKYIFDYKKNLWAKARIEFEYRASNFEQHGHDPNQCDFIVCWLNDWPDCPVNVIELKAEILKLPSK
jgi:hypothetical protein